MYMHLSPHRMSVPPPPAGYLDSHEPSGLVLVSKIVLGAIATALGAALIIAAPPTVMVPIASVLAVGLVVSLVVVSIDKRSSVGLQESVGLMSIVLLLFALISPPGLRALLASAGLLGLVFVRLAAADSGWARRGSRQLAGHFDHRTTKSRTSE